MFKNSFFYTFEKLGPKLLSIVILPVFLRLIKPELWAEITLLLALQLLISYFLTKGDERSLLKFTSNENLMYFSIASVLKYSFIMVISFELLGLLFVDLPFSLEYGLPFRFMLISTALISLNKLLLAKLRSLEKSQEIFYSSLVDSVFVQLVQLLLIGTVVYFDGFDSRVIVTVFFFSQTIGNILKFYYFKVKTSLNTKLIIKFFTKKYKSDISNFSNLSFLLLLSSYFLRWQDRYFVENIFDLKILGVYSVTTRLSNLGMVFISSILITAYAKYWPKKDNNYEDGMVNKITRDIFLIASFTMSTIMLSTTIFGEYILPVAYLNSINLINFSVITVFLQIFVSIITIDYGRQNRLKKIVLFNFLVSISQFFIYFSYNFTNLEQIFMVQIMTIMFYIIIFFVKEIVFVYPKVVTLTVVVISFSYLVNSLILENNIFIYKIIGIALVVIYLSIVGYKWVKIE